MQKFLYQTYKLQQKIDKTLHWNDCKFQNDCPCTWGVAIRCHKETHYTQHIIVYKQNYTQETKCTKIST